jgi:hypothetical protein
MPIPQLSMATKRATTNRAAPPTEACTCRRSLIDIEPHKTGWKDPGMRWVRRCACGIPHFCGDLKE